MHTSEKRFAEISGIINLILLQDQEKMVLQKLYPRTRKKREGVKGVPGTDRPRARGFLSYTSGTPSPPGTRIGFF
jgi:hypothetical protein